MSHSPLISIVMSCRIAGNTNSMLPNCMKSLMQHAADARQFEVLIKFDDDDADVQKTLEAAKQSGANISHIITPRGKGYFDLHKAYMDLFAMASPSSQLFWVISDDMEVHTQDWDQHLIDAWKPHAHLSCVLHAKKLMDLQKAHYSRAIVRCDAYPIWSRKWLASAGFGFTFSTDGWTSLLEYLLFRDHGVDSRIAVPGIRLYRHTDDMIDSEQSDRWTNERQTMIDLVESDNLKSIINELVRGLAEKIKAEGGSLRKARRSLRQQLKSLFMER